MPHQKIPITLKYQKKGTTPPIYVAGSFSDPPWQPQEMDVSIDQHGDHIFTKRVLVDHGSEIQYKFRIGPGNWWAFDDCADTVTDDRGNTNNILRVSANEPQEADAKARNPQVNKLKGSGPSSGTQTPDIAKTAAEVADSARILDPETPEPEISDGEAGRIGYRRLSSTPIRQVAETAMEVADVAAMLDAGDSFSDEEIDGEDDEDGECPVFSHEFMGPNCHDSNGEVRGRRESMTASRLDDTAIDDDDVDFDDPQLEAFPSTNRESILAAVRRISTSIDADRTVVEGIPPSPIVPTFRQHKTVDSPEDSGATPSSIDKPPKDSQHLQPDNSIKQSGSGHSGTRETSIGSLGSIAEDDESHNYGVGNESEQVAAPFVQHPGPSWGSAPKPAASEDSNDEGISMNVESKRKDSSSKDRHATTVRNTSSACENNSSNVEATYEEENRSKSVDPSNQPDLRKRTVGRSATPPSTHYFQRPSQTPNWLDACLRLVFVKWIGGFAGWLYGGRYRALVVAGTAAIVVGVGILWQNPIRLCFVGQTDGNGSVTITSLSMAKTEYLPHAARYNKRQLDILFPSPYINPRDGVMDFLVTPQACSVVAATTFPRGVGIMEGRPGGRVACMTGSTQFDRSNSCANSNFTLQRLTV
ncbi:hypothetical protein M434DRAFT_13031 [Hypoxylon sp. CO27-5]|nr:hypothetical protein M434DRAFT_13031 [Hypoxylon sp. CO27-5]